MKAVRVFLLAVGLSCSVLPILAQVAPHSPAGRCRDKVFAGLVARRAAEARRWEAAIEAAAVQPHQALDVLHYDMDIALNPTAQTIAGTVTMRFRATASLSQVKMRLYRSLKVTALKVDGQAATSTKRKSDDIQFNLSPAAASGSEHEVTVVYGGAPTWDATMGGGVIFATHNGTPVAATESEPFAAYRWWPLVEDVSDKFTFDMRLTVPAGMVGVSNGVVTNHTRNVDGTETYEWHEGYPIATYLVCANVTNYTLFTDTYTGLDGTTVMPLDHYVYPEDLAVAQTNFATIPQMLAFYGGIAGDYAFLSEKFGQVEVPYPGMEHQTITAVDQYWVTGQADYSPGDATLMYAHELAHHWWGDDVTCGTWHDVWLNEGFGTYFESLWWAHTQGLTEGEAFFFYDLDGLYNGYLGGTVYTANENQPFADEMRIYYKGAWVLHMLKKVMGEGPFYQALRAYRAAHHFGNATTADFQAACEGVYGQSLAWFFDEWVYTPFRPIYRIASSTSGGTCTVALQQLQKHKIVHRTTDRDTYIMPVDITLHFSDGTSETHTVLDNARTQTFSFPVSKTVQGAGLDEDGWLLKVMK
jgi:aminopeptidase N